MSTAEHDQTKLGYIFVLVVQVALDRKLVKSLSRGCSSPRNGFVLPVNINFHLYCREGKPLPYTSSNNNLSLSISPNHNKINDIDESKESPYENHCQFYGQP